MDFKDFCEKYNATFNQSKKFLNVEYDENILKLIIRDKEIVFTKEEFHELRDEASKYSFDGITMYNDNNFETIITTTNRSVYIHRQLDQITEIEDSAHNISYLIKNMSNLLLYKIFETLDLTSKPSLFLFYIPEDIINNQELHVLDLLRISLRGFMSIKIISKQKNSLINFKKYLNSFVFTMAYNTNFVFRPLEEKEDLFPKRSIRKQVRTHNFDELVAPQLSYNNELTEQYYMALITDDVFVKFICFYHVLENFFEEVYKDSMFKGVQQIIQNPGFSPKRTKDIALITDLVTKKQRINKSGFQGTELEALELTLEKYIDFSSFGNELNDFAPDSVAYYRSSQVPFSDGDQVDLLDLTNQKLGKKLAARIYKTRNSLVHSKSNDFRIKEKGIYKPLTDNKDLAKEIPLMRLLAEKIIIANAEQL